MDFPSYSTTISPRSKPASCNLAFFYKVFHNCLYHIDRDGKSYTLITTASGKYSGIDTNNLSPYVDERSATVAGVNGGVSLYHVFVLRNSYIGSSCGANDANRHCL